MSEVIKTGTEIAKNPGAAVDVVKTGVELVKKGAEILPDPRDFRDLAELVQAASSGKKEEGTKWHVIPFWQGWSKRCNLGCVNSPPWPEAAFWGLLGPVV